MSPKTTPGKIGVLLVNLGTPDAPTAPAIRRYLAQFLGDQRVVDYPRWMWMPVLHGIILQTRPPKVAKLYQRIWTEDGSPLLVHTRRQAEGLQARLGDGYAVVYGMRYGNPSVESAVNQLKEQNVSRIIVFPMFPHFSTSTVASVYDEVIRVTLGQPNTFYQPTNYDVPALRFVPSYYNHPAYIQALHDRVREHVAEHGEPEQYLFSYHGVPRRFIRSGEPYQAQCMETSKLLADKLGLQPEQWMTTFQSQFGPEQWIGPATDDTLEDLAARGVKHVLATCPGFVADCLETTDEIGTEAAETFVEAGGEQLSFMPSLNDHPTWLDAMAAIVYQESAGWALPETEANTASAVQSFLRLERIK
jgi:ferrochelatase